jgi:hypothetical protein
VVGVWYGKGPGVDRSGDVLRHTNLYGAHPRGGALVLAGDDPGSKSSTVPCVSERSLAALGIPVLYPGSAEELIRLGLYGTALSRASGCWVALKIVADVADGLFTVDADFAAVDIVVPSISWNDEPWTYQQRVLVSRLNRCPTSVRTVAIREATPTNRPARAATATTPTSLPAHLLRIVNATLRHCSLHPMCRPARASSDRAGPRADRAAGPASRAIPTPRTACGHCGVYAARSGRHEV